MWWVFTVLSLFPASRSILLARASNPAYVSGPPLFKNDVVETSANHDESVVPPSNVRLAPLDLVIADTASTLASLPMLQYKEAEGCSREGTHSEMPGTPKGPGRVSESSSSPANKQPRKMKASDF
ncbi:hypothetical protein LINGRAHAP2_LOCUS9626 [Linum grandiflorum]